MCAIALWAVANQVHASPIFVQATPYIGTADSPFVGVAFNYYYIEDFEDDSLNTLGVSSTTGGQVLDSGVYTDSVDSDDGLIDGSGTSGHSFYSGGTSIITFAFDKDVLGVLPTHVGIVWTDVGFSADVTGFGSLLFEAIDENGDSLGSVGPILVGDGNFTGETGDDLFLGVINLNGISSISIGMNSWDWEVDHLQYGAADRTVGTAVVPEPVTIALLGVGLVGMGFARRSCGSE